MIFDLTWISSSCLILKQLLNLILKNIIFNPILYSEKKVLIFLFKHSKKQDLTYSELLYVIRLTLVTKLHFFLLLCYQKKNKTKHISTWNKTTRCLQWFKSKLKEHISPGILKNSLIMKEFLEWIIQFFPTIPKGHKRSHSRLVFQVILYLPDKPNHWIPKHFNQKNNIIIIYL